MMDLLPEILKSNCQISFKKIPKRKFQ